MTSASLLSPSELHEWDAFLDDARGGHFLQSAPFALARKPLGLTPRFLAVRKGGRIAAGAMIQEITVPLLGRVLYCPRGPMVPDMNSGLMEELVDAVTKLARARGAFLFKVDPAVKRNDVKPDHALRAAGFRDASPECSALGTQSNAVMRVNLERTPGQILDSFEPRTRYNVRRAAERGVEIVESARPSAFRPFYRVLRKTGRARGMPMFPSRYYRELFERFLSSGRCRIFLARACGRYVAAVATVSFGVFTWFLYGGTDRGLGGLYPTEALHFRAMVRARERGSKVYDLRGSGVLDPETEGEEHPLWGIYKFKRGFSPRLVRFAPEMDLVFDERRARAFGRLVAPARAAVRAVATLQGL